MTEIENESVHLYGSQYDNLSHVLIANLRFMFYEGELLFSVLTVRQNQIRDPMAPNTNR